MAVRKISDEALKNLEERAYAASRGFPFDNSLAAHL